MQQRTDPSLSLAASLVALLAVLVIPGSCSVSGPVLVTLTPTHGVHLLDLGVVALGLALVAAVAARAWPDALSVPAQRVATA